MAYPDTPIEKIEDFINREIPVDENETNPLTSEHNLISIFLRLYSYGRPKDEVVIILTELEKLNTAILNNGNKAALYASLQTLLNELQVTYPA